MKMPATRALLKTALITILFSTCLPQLEAVAQDRARTGKAVYDEVCADCHQAGVDSAPRIGDVEAWRMRANQGLSALTAHALQGIRQMPAHGGQPELGDLEIARAITYMVNSSGGDWVEPAARSDIMAERSGKEVVDAYCSECHQDGKGGAPKIGDLGAWVLRLRQGLPYAVRSAIRGHGGMPPRGGVADLTDDELRNAILYMFNPADSATGDEQVVTARVLESDANHARAGGIDIYLGFVSAEYLRTFPRGSGEHSMHGGVPHGNDWYHVNVSVLDTETRTPISDAQVDVRVEDPDKTTVSKSLQPMELGGGSYGNYFRMQPHTPYRVTVQVAPPGAATMVEAEFWYEHY